MAELLHLAPGIDVLPPEDDEKLRYSQAAVDHVVNFLSMLCFGQNEWAGKPFELAEWQLRDCISPFYGVQVQDLDGRWVRYRRYLYCEIPKKNGKTELASALGLFHLLADDESRPNVGIFAADKDNASQIYECAKYMVEHTDLGQPEHDPKVWCLDSIREIRTKWGGKLKVYSSDAATKHGYSFSCIIIDELHAQPNRKLWDVLTVGSDAARRQQAVIVLTTAGDDPDRNSIGWEKHEMCRRILAVRRGKPEREMDEDDPQWLPVMYGIGILCEDDPDQIAKVDIWDPETWKICNPSYGITLSPRKFRAEARAARQSEAGERNFRWLRLNQWITTKSVGWIPLSIYDKTQWAGKLSELRGKRCYAGLDLSTTTDLTALVLLFPPQAGLDTWVALPYAWRPADTVLEAEQRDHVPYRDWERAGFIQLCPGDQVDYTIVEEAIWEANRTYKIEMLGCDPYMSRALTQRLQEGRSGGDGQPPDKPITVVEIPQTMMGMSPPSKELERLTRSHQMLHVHNTCARWCFGNVRMATDGNENIKPMKNRSTGRIDITVAWIISMATAQIAADQPTSLSSALERDDWSM